MSVWEQVNYVLLKNPVSTSIIDSIKFLGNMGKQNSNSNVKVKLPPALENLQVSRVVLSGNIFVKLAGISGATAVILGAYGAHSLHEKQNSEECKRIYETANKYHFIHSLALFGVPLCSFPMVAGTFLSLGMVLFCGTCYYDALTGKTNFRKFTPVGGTCLILGWICLLF